MNRWLVAGTFLTALALAAAAGATPYGASALADNNVTVSGTWTSVQWYKSDGCYSGVGDPTVSDWKTQAQGSTPVNLSTTASDTHGAAASSVQASAPGLVPTIAIHSDADVYGLVETSGHWAMGYSQGGANWLTSGATQNVTFTVDYTYDLDLINAHPDMPYAYAKIYVAFWGPSSQLLLTPDAEFVQVGNYLVKTVRIEAAGTSTGTVTGSKSWVVSVTSGAFYSFWAEADASVWTSSEPTATEPATWGAVKALYR